MKKRPNRIVLTLLYAGAFAAFYGGFSMLRGFISVFLRDRGFSFTQIGVITCVHMLFSAIAQPMAARVLKRFPKLTLRQFTVICCGLAVLTTVFQWLVPPIFPIYLLIYILMSLFELSTTSIIISIGMDYVNAGADLNMGFCRGFGSLGYAGGCLLAGWMIERFGSISLLTGNVIMLALLAILVTLLPSPSLYQSENPDKEEVQEKADESQEEKSSIGQFIRENPVFTVFLIANVPVFISHCFVNTYLPNVAAQFNVGSDVVGRLIAVSSMLELVPMLLYERWRRHVTPFTLLCLSTIGFSAKAFFIAIAGNLTQLTFALMLQMTGYAMYCIPVIHFTNLASKPKDRVLAQSLVVMMTELGFTAGGLIGGIVLDHTSVRALLWIGTVICVLGAVMMSCSVLKLKPRQHSLN